MKYFFLVTTLLILASSCQKKEGKSATAAPDKKADGKKFEMYQMSEMAALMEQMYAQNTQVKERIIKGEPIGEFPESFLKIHTAKFTDESDNDAFFKENAKLYIAAQKLIYEDPTNAKKHFNDGVQACLTCHEMKCGGPVPKIKKLFIK